VGYRGVEIGLRIASFFYGPDESVQALKSRELVGIAESGGIKGGLKHRERSVVCLQRNGKGMAILAAEGK